MAKEVTIEDLEAQLAAVKAELASKTNAENTLLESNAGLQTKLEESEKTLLESNAELQARLEESEKTVEEVKVIVKHDKKRYEVITPKVQVGGQLYLAADLKKHPEVVKVLVEKGSGVLKAI